MKYDNFITELKNLLTSKQKFQTIEQGKEFEAVYSAPKVIIFPGTSKQEWPTNINDFYKIWKIAQSLPKHERYHPGHYQKETRSASYILFFIKYILKDEEME